MLFQHKPFSLARPPERIEGDRQVDHARRTRGERDLEGRCSRHGPCSPAEALDAHEVADHVVAGTRQTELPGGLADRTPRGGDRDVVAVERDDERVEPRVLGRDCEAHEQSVPAPASRFVTIPSRKAKGRLVLFQHKPERALIAQALGVIWAKTRKLGLARGTSWNSGFRQPSSSPRLS